MDALAVVLRGFSALDGVPAQRIREPQDFQAEPILNDLAVVERRIEWLAKEAAMSGKKPS